MKRISERVQPPGNVTGRDFHLLARKVGSGEVGILIGYEEGDKKKATAGVYWNSIEDAVADLKDVIEYFNSEEDQN